MKIPEHTHKFMRVTVGNKKVVRENGQRRIIRVAGTDLFKCMYPGCTYFKPRELAISNKSICWRCGQELILNMENTTLRKPTHVECRKKRDVAA